MKLACVWLLPLISLLQACVGPQPDSAAEAREPVRWILVERRYVELSNPAAQSDGQVNSDATVLAFQPLYKEDLAWEVVVSPEEHYVELLNLTPSGPTSPGEVVSATVRVGKAKRDRYYRLLATPSKSDVRIVGETHVIVKGAGEAVFQFTSCTSGRAGIAVAVERVETEDAGSP